MYPIVPHADRHVPWNYWEDQFTKEELDKLEAVAREATDAAITGGVGVNPELRRSKVKWVSPCPEFEWLFAKLSRMVAISNSQYYRFDLSGFGEALQFTRYESTDSGTYGWHQDYGMEISRKLSLAIQLSDPDDYKGGWFEFLFGVEPIRVQKKRGMVVIFPSHALHRVTPVTEGVRHSLVVWVSGPPFR